MFLAHRARRALSLTEVLIAIFVMAIGMISLLVLFIVGLQNARFHDGRHFGRGVADIDLAAGNVKFSAVERERFCQSGYGMFGRSIGGGIGTRRVGGDRAVIDDPAAAGSLAFHDAKSLLRAEESARQVGVDDFAPLLER